MSTLKTIAVFAMLFVFSSIVRAEDKPDYAKLIVGKWEVTKADAGTVPPGSTMEFTKDLKFIVTAKKDPAEAKFEGTYKIEKDTFTFTVSLGDMERSQTITITKISDKEMHTKDKDGKVVECTKKK